MFDTVGAFTKQFTPVDAGYLYYPSRKGGGKLVSADEFEVLKSDWQRVTGRKGLWKTVGIIVIGILLWTLVSEALALPEWTDSIPTFLTVVGLSGWIFWASLAPRRLVNGRPDVVPPKPLKDARRQARSALNWPFIFFVFLFAGATFFSHLSAPDNSFSWWAWTIGSGVMLVAYAWIAVQKLRDRPKV